ncbi:MAG: hypothetical protein JXA01_07480, partial [Dehalococcoidia bacterium]|nr:hypothetical protein [Dehalococcoidia bacterium]
MKRVISGLIVCALLAVIPVLSACSGGGGTTTGSTTSQSAAPTTSSTTSTTTSLTSSSTTSETTSASSTTTTSSTSMPATTTSSTSTTSSTTDESLADILGNFSQIDSVYYEMETTVTGMPTEISKVWIKGSKMKTETDAGGEKIITILDNAAQTM